MPQDRRRFAAIAAGALVVLVAVAALFAGGDGDGGDARDAAPLPAPELARSFTDPRLGLSVRRPADWTARKRRGVVRLASPRRGVIVAISAPARRRYARRLLNEAVDAVRDSLRGAREVGEMRTATLAGLPARTRVVRGRNARGEPVRVLVSTLRGRRRAYLVEVFAAESASAARLAEAQAVLGSLRLGR